MVWLGEELATASRQRAIRHENGCIGAIGHSFIKRRPQAFGGLEFRRAGREEREMETWREMEFGRAMPGSAIDDQDNFFFAAHAFGVSKGRQGDLHGGGVDGGQDQPVRSAISRMDKAIHITPFIPMSADGDWPVPPSRPHAPDDRLQSSASLVMRPNFDDCLGNGAPKGRDLLPELFLKASRCAEGAAWAWRRRGTCKLQPSRCKYAHPNCGWALRLVCPSIHLATLAPVHKPPAWGARANLCCNCSRCFSVRRAGRPPG